MSLSAVEVTNQPLPSESLHPSESDTCGNGTGSSSTATHQHHQMPVFGCGCNHCTIANFMDGCQKPITTRTGLPYLDASGLTKHQKSILVGRLLDESEEMLFAFQRLVSTARRSLIRQNILPEDLVAELLSLDALDPVLNKTEMPTPVFRECQKELQEAKSINTIFSTIKHYISHSLITKSLSTFLWCLAQMMIRKRYRIIRKHSKGTVNAGCLNVLPIFMDQEVNLVMLVL